MLIDCRSLRLSESDEVDDVGEYLDQSIMSGLQKVIEREVCDTALYASRQQSQLLNSMKSSSVPQQVTS